MRPISVISLAVVLFSISANVICVNQQNALLIDEEAKVEETDYDLLCNNLNITVSFSGLSLNTIQDNFLASPLITCLDLSNNHILTISNNAFDNLPNLRYLNLADNMFNLNDFFKNSFFNLETLILNNISPYYEHHMDLLITGTYPRLRKLYLKNNQYKISKIRAISKINFPSLSHLYLAGNTISYDEFSWLPETLQYLDLTDHKLERLTLQNLKHLKWIFLRTGTCNNCNSLKDIYFENLHSLLYLSVPSNNIEQITSSTFLNVTSLKYLDISDNSIVNIESDAFESMQNLEFLNISNNNIEAIHVGTLDRLKNLKTLNLNKNMLSSIPIILEELNVELMYLSCNKIKNVGRRVLKQLPNLEQLYLQDNAITQIDEEAFVGLEKLKILILSNNQLSALPANWLLPMISLEELDLSGNQFIEFGNLGLSESSPLKSLYLSKQLRYIEPQSLYTTPENVTIYLDDTSPHFDTCVEENVHNNYYG